MKLIIPLLALLYASDLTACRLGPPAYDLRTSFTESKDAAVAFRGRVESVTPSENGELKRITIEAGRWWKGRPRERVVVIGSSGTMAGTDCEGVFDFTARVGSTVLIVGEERSGEIYPSGLLSRQENIAKLPQALEAAAAAQSDNIGKKPLPAGASLVCKQFVDGFSGVNKDIRFSIVWESYGASQSVHDVVGHYEKVFDRPSVAGDSERHTWRLDDRLIYTVFAASEGMRWLRCAGDTSGIAGVILVSRIR